MRIKGSTLLKGDDGKLYDFRRGQTVDVANTPRDVLRKLQAQPDAIMTGEDETALGLDATTPENQARIVAELEAKGITAENGGEPPVKDDPEPSIDVAAATVEDIARFIDANDLNAGPTVALAGGDPGLAAKVLQAEKLSAGGDGRSTVVKPLEALAAE